MTKRKQIHVLSSPTQRPEGATQPAPAPQTLEEWRALYSKSVTALRELGCRAWDAPDEEGFMLMLLPIEWHSSIPAGLQLVNVFNATFNFDPKLTVSHDRRVGVLPYGIRARVTH